MRVNLRRYEAGSKDRRKVFANYLEGVGWQIYLTIGACGAVTSIMRSDLFSGCSRSAYITLIFSEVSLPSPQIIRSDWPLKLP